MHEEVVAGAALLEKCASAGEKWPQLFPDAITTLIPRRSSCS